MLVPAILRHPHAAITAVADPRRELLEAFVRDLPAEAHTEIEALCKQIGVKYFSRHDQARWGHVKVKLAEPLH